MIQIGNGVQWYDNREIYGNQLITQLGSIKNAYVINMYMRSYSHTYTNQMWTGFEGKCMFCKPDGKSLVRGIGEQSYHRMSNIYCPKMQPTDWVIFKCSIVQLAVLFPIAIDRWRHVKNKQNVRAPKSDVWCQPFRNKDSKSNSC